MSNKYLLLALPTSISSTGDPDDAFAALSQTISASLTKPDSSIHRFPIPEFKIGTLDALVLQADELAKLDANVEGAVNKAADVLSGTVREGNVERHKSVNDKPVENYLQAFSWNKVKYRSDRSIAQLLEVLQKEVISLDNDIKSKYSSYQAVKSNLVSVQRKQTGNLSTKSLAPILKPTDFIPPSEYLQTQLLVVPRPLERDWLRSYETLSPMVVPRSSREITRDAEYILYSCVVFKKHAAEFCNKARAAKFAPREFAWSEDALRQEEREARDVEALESRLFGEVLRLARTGYSDLFQAWVHVKALRVFVESVLRYGLPLEFVSAVVQTTEKHAKRIKGHLDSAYDYLGGNAFGRDKKGNIKDDVGDLGAGMLGDTEYSAYCYFEFDVV